LMISNKASQDTKLSYEDAQRAGSADGKKRSFLTVSWSEGLAGSADMLAKKR
jgi:hypothetical protein